VWAQLEVGPPPEPDFSCFGARGALPKGPRG
jgi:hypothetical protein